MQMIRIRYVSSEKTEGCEKAPIEVVKALRDVRCSEKGKVIDVDKLNLEEIHVDLDDSKGAHSLIFKNSKDVFENNPKALFIGGDQSISYSIVRAFDEVEENGLLIVFDAHGDCLDKKDVNHRGWLRKLVENGFNGSRIIIIGARSLGLEELDFLNKNKITLVKMDFLQEDLAGVCDGVMERARGAGGFYVSIDLDVIDPGIAPGVSEIEPGGISGRDLIYFVKRLSLLGNFRGGDVVEINPSKDVNGMTVKLGAKLLGEMI